MLARRGIVVLLACLATPLAAQQPDTVPRDSVRNVHPNHGGMMLVMGLTLAAPSALLLFPQMRKPSEGDTVEVGFWRSHVSVSAGAGMAFVGADRGPALTARVDALAGGFHADLRVEEYHLDAGRIRLWDARIGYLIHPTPTFAGGVMVGYREAPDAKDEWGRGAVEIGFPLISGRMDAGYWVRWEPTYIISVEGVNFSPRVDFQMPIGRTPLVAGVHFEPRGLRKGDPLLATVSIGLRP